LLYKETNYLYHINENNIVDETNLKITSVHLTPVDLQYMCALKQKRTSYLPIMH